MTFNLYGIVDTVPNPSRYISLHYYSNDEDFIRRGLLYALYDIPLRDVKCYRLGTFDDETGVITHCEPVEVDAGKYAFPRTPVSPVGDDVSLDKLSENALKASADFKAHLSLSHDNPVFDKEVVNE